MRVGGSLKILFDMFDGMWVLRGRQLKAYQFDNMCFSVL